MTDGHAHSHTGDGAGSPSSAGVHAHRFNGVLKATHDHMPSRQADRRYLTGALALISAFMVGEILAAIAAGSLVLLADAGHMLTDAGALGIAIWATRLAERPSTDVWTFGFKRAEILSAALNGIALLVIATLVTAGAVDRLLHPAAVHGPVLIIVAGIGIAVNLGATWILAKANQTSLNIAGAFTHLLTDLWAFIGTAVAGIVIVATGFERADAIASLVIVVLMLQAAHRLLRDSGRVLLEAAPAAVDLTDVRSHLLQAPHVTDVHDLHAWVVTSDLPALSAHVVVSDQCFADGHAPQILDELQACLLGHFDVEHSTFQLEPPGHTDHETAAH